MRELERDHPDAAAPLAGGAPLPALAVVGDGRVGGAIARAARRAGIAAETAGREDATAACRRAEIALLCVPDGAIVTACDAAAAAVPPLRFVGHVSGATRLDALAAATARGAEAFSLHPLQTVPDPEAEIAGASCGIAGSSPAALELARGLAAALGMRPFEVPEAQRAAYHAAAAVASNFLVALEESAAELLERLGVADARELLAPLVLRSAANWAERGEAALTGPIARGDAATVERHRAALRELAPELLPLYETLAERTAALAAATAEEVPA